MQLDSKPASKAMLWTGYVLSVIPGLMLLFDGVMKIVQPQYVVEQTVQLGYPENAILGIGVAVLISAVLYLIPRTAVLGAILLTGYLGGAVASHVRHGDAPLFVLLPAVFGAVLWLGLVLRDARLRALLPFRS